MARGGQRTWEKAGGSGVWAGCEARSRLIFLGVEEAGVPPSSQSPHPMKGVGLPGTWALVGRNQHLSLWLEVEVGGLDSPHVLNPSGNCAQCLFISSR